MSSIFKYLLLSIFIVNMTQANELSLKIQGLHLTHIYLSEQYCKETTIDKKLCKEKKLTYLDYEDTSLPQYLRASKKHMKPFLKAYKRQNLKHSTVSDIKDFNNKISGEWYNATNIDLFSKTSTTYTLSINLDGYEGGAHGYHTVTYNNYFIRTQKKVILDDLFLPGYIRTLYKIAELHYKQTYNLKPDQSLAYDGWFEDKFVLTENFAITPKGIYFLYNSYEIKPYSSGQTKFMLPYSKLQTIIDPEGIVGFSIKKVLNNHDK